MRLAFLGLLLIVGTATALITEVLGVMHLLHRGPLLAAWFIVLAGTAWRFRPRWTRPGMFEAVIWAAIAGISGIVGFTALFSPPNSTDAMGYHLPRVVYWAQAACVDFFPVHYYSQIMLQPLAEYIVLHSWILSGGDRFANLVQFSGFVGSVVGVSLIAESLGAGRRGHALSALVCATIPNGILQASGAKNDYLLSLWLVAFAVFALRGARLQAAAAVGLALLTKGTAYVFAPGVAIAVFASRPKEALRFAPFALAAVVILNGPHYWRNLDFSGSPLGLNSADDEGKFRWTNRHFGVRTTASNAMRHLSQHLGARSDAWNRGVYDAVILAHRWIGADPNDPDTTWPDTKFEPPNNSNHEANGPNRWHLLLLLVSAAAARKREWRWYPLGLAGAALLFCVAFRWQLYMTRLHLPLFVLGAPLAGLVAERFLPSPAQILVCLLLVNNARPYLFANWTRPLTGRSSLLRTERRDNYFADMTIYNAKGEYERAVELTLASGCRDVGIDNHQFQLEYPYQVLLLEKNPHIRFIHSGVRNRSARYRARPEFQPCAVLCLSCFGIDELLNRHRSLKREIPIGRFVLFLR